MPNKLLVHTCCCHCAAYTLLFFKGQGPSSVSSNTFDVSALWYNPNIHPFLEHEERRKALVSLTEKFNVPLIMTEDYEMPEFLRRVAGHEDDRCRYCYEMRLSKTADIAIEKGFDAFSSTLLISPWQKHDLIRETGERIAQEKGIPFIYKDLRKHYSDSRRITKSLNLYRQQYCGCIYSEWERYREKEQSINVGDIAMPENAKSEYQNMND